MLGFRLPERAFRNKLSDYLPRPFAGCFNVPDGAGRHALLLLIGVEDSRPVTFASVVSLAVKSRRIVNLEEELKQFPVAQDRRIKDDFNRFSMGAMISVCCIRNVSAGIADSTRNHAGKLTKKVLHPPEAAAGENCSFGLAHAVSFLSGDSKSLTYSPYPSSSNSSRGMKRREAELMQYRRPPASRGPSLKTWPKWLSAFEERTSVRAMPRLLS